MTSILAPDIWAAEATRVGDTPVLRPLPSPAVSSVGPFVFLDHFGPAPTRGGTLPAHPHAGIEVMTYLIEGANTHRDSAGHTGSVAAGGAQWMRAGRGILHAETVLEDDTPVTHGLQIWARLPIAKQDDEPAYRGYEAGDFPVWTEGGARLKLLTGSLGDRTGPMSLSLDAFMLHVSLAAGGTVEVALPDPNHRYGIYGITGGARFDDVYSIGQGDFARLPEHSAHLRLMADANGPSEVFILGGAPAPTPLVFGGPFVLDSPEALMAAERRFVRGEMGTLDGVPF